ncbi:class I adenylate-forming enzyme family protein [Klenkia brasiliensis]|uniref:Fatty-acyl-CoA synthase n=1 Tax=Klenkia brasiliensis TaxID=333142 RepID=A0A1G7TFD1_9ACTN|nr:AMP-binding protein [Klenkia brasiliensis]SDG34036.1 fatty-acyl-CoA synthase [Klenkia brasiliensis]
MSLPSATTLPALLREAAERTPDAEALVVGPTRWTYAQLSRRADLAAEVLAGLGVGADDTVALLAPNIAEWVPLAVGAQILGARVDAFNTWVKAYDLDHLLASSAASVLVLVDRVRSSDLLGELESLLPELSTGLGWRSERFPDLRHVVVLGDRVPAGARSWAELVAAAEPAPRVPTARAEAPAFVLYTSGSTSHPKAVPLRHRDLVLNGFHIGERMGVTAADRIWFGSPLFWSFGCANALVNAMSHGACFVLQEEFTPAGAAALMAAEAVTVAYLLPSMVDALVGSVAIEVAAVDSLRTGATIGRPEEVRRAVEDLGISGMCNVYGATETYGNCCVTDHRTPVDVRVTTQGRPLPGVEVRVVDEAGQVLPAGEPGELQVRGRVTPGYLGDDAATAAAFTPDGWYRTGDRMLVDADGAVSFVSRTTDMIKTSGINVSPAEVESFLAGHPDVVEVTVLGSPHPSREQVVVAFVVAREPGLTAAGLIDWSRARVAGYKVPWVAAVVDELPRTGTGKLARRTLQQAAAELVAARLEGGA